MCDLALLKIEADPETTAIINQLCNSGCHLSTLKLQIKSIEALEAACRRVGLELKPAQMGRADYRIMIPGARMGILVQKDGENWKLVQDSDDRRRIEQLLGPDANRLRQSYGIEVAKLEAARQGYSVFEEEMADGAVKLRIQVSA